MKMAAPVGLKDDEWIVNKARTCRKQDPFAARSWLIVARTLFPRNFSIQFEMYQLEKSSRNIRDMVRLFEDMLANFSNESQLWTEIHAMSEALQSDATDEQTVFLKDVFTSLPQEIQCQVLLKVADSSKDVLQQCRLILLIVDRYPSQVPDQGEKLVESLLQAEQLAQMTSPVNPYRRYLACSVLPLLLRSGQPKPLTRNLCHWLNKAVEFYICFIAQKSIKAGSCVSNERKMVPGESSSLVTSLDVSDGDASGFSNKDDHVADPWHQLCQLIHLVADHLQWNIGRLFQGDSLDSQWQQVMMMSEGLRMSCLDPSREEIITNQVLLCASVLLVQCLLAYMAVVDPSSSSGQGLSSSHHSLVLIELFRIEPSDGNTEQKSKRLKTEQEVPKVFVAGKVSVHGHAEDDVVENFLMALNCWHLLNSPILEKEFKKLNQNWSADHWPWLSRFETDILLYQGYYKEVISQLQPVQSAQCSSATRHRQMSLQLACCYYSVANYTAVVDMILYVFGTFQMNSSSAQCQEMPVTPSVKGRHLCLLPLVDSDMFSYCVHLLIACLKDKALMSNPNGEAVLNYSVNSSQLDMLFGHMMVLMQHDWPKYEPMMCEIIDGIKKRGQFAYGLFFNYIINIDLLEEFAYLRTPEGGRVSLDILPTSPGKPGSQSRTVTRGVNKGVKEDFKAAMDRQITRTEENVSHLLKTFILDEADIMTKNLLT